MVVEKGTVYDIDELEQLYDSLNEYLGRHTNYPGWIRGIYPARDTAEDGVRDEGLYVIRDQGKIVGTVILRHEPEAAYLDCDWHVDLDYSDIFVVYTFAVHPQYLKKGVGKNLMAFIISHGMETGVRAIRLDVYEKNTPAISLYKSFGFEYMDTVDLGLGKYGLDRFELYQKLL